MNSIHDTIRNVENGLTEFSAPADMFIAGSAAGKATYSIYERMESYKVPGVSIAVVDNFELKWKKSYGVENAETKFPVDPSTLFEAASSTKLLTAVAALQLVEEGEIDLDEDVNNYLTSWRVPDDEFTGLQKVSLRLLLSHQSGFNKPDGGFKWQHDSSPTLLQILEGEIPAENQPVRLDQVPGVQWQYSNLGYVLIQLIIEELKGMPFALVMQKSIFEPLGMRSSVFRIQANHAKDRHLAFPHDADGIVHQHQLNPSAHAHGGLLTTAEDYALFLIEIMKSHLGRSSKILSTEMTKEILSPQVELDPAVLGVRLAQGLGPLLYMQGPNPIFLHPGGNFPGANCWPIALPKLGKAAVVLTNGANGEILGMEVLTSIMRETNWNDD